MDAFDLLHETLASASNIGKCARRSIRIEAVHSWHRDTILLFISTILLCSLSITPVAIVFVVTMLLMSLLINLGKLLPMCCCFTCRVPMLLCCLYIAVLH